MKVKRGLFFIILIVGVFMVGSGVFGFEDDFPVFFPTDIQDFTYDNNGNQGVFFGNGDSVYQVLRDDAGNYYGKHVDCMGAFCRVDGNYPEVPLNPDVEGATDVWDYLDDYFLESGEGDDPGNGGGDGGDEEEKCPDDPKPLDGKEKEDTDADDTVETLDESARKEMSKDEAEKGKDDSAEEIRCRLNDVLSGKDDESIENAIGLLKSLENDKLNEVWNGKEGGEGLDQAARKEFLEKYGESFLGAKKINIGDDVDLDGEWSGSGDEMVLKIDGRVPIDFKKLKNYKEGKMPLSWGGRDYKGTARKFTSLDITDEAVSWNFDVGEKGDHGSASFTVGRGEGGGNVVVDFDPSKMEYTVNGETYTWANGAGHIEVDENGLTKLTAGIDKNKPKSIGNHPIIEDSQGNKHSVYQSKVESSKLVRELSGKGDGYHEIDGKWYVKSTSISGKPIVREIKSGYIAPEGFYESVKKYGLDGEGGESGVDGFSELSIQDQVAVAMTVDRIASEEGEFDVETVKDYSAFLVLDEVQRGSVGDVIVRVKGDDFKVGDVSGKPDLIGSLIYRDLSDKSEPSGGGVFAPKEMTAFFSKAPPKDYKGNYFAYYKNGNKRDVAVQSPEGKIYYRMLGVGGFDSEGKPTKFVKFGEIRLDGNVEVSNGNVVMSSVEGKNDLKFRKLFSYPESHKDVESFVGSLFDKVYHANNEGVSYSAPYDEGEKAGMIVDGSGNVVTLGEAKGPIEDYLEAQKKPVKTVQTDGGAGTSTTKDDKAGGGGTKGVSGGGVTVGGTTYNTGKKNTWGGETYSEFKTASEGKIVLLKIGAEWCGPCGQSQESFDYFSSQNEGVTSLDVDVGTSNDVQEKLKVSKYPTFIAFRDGKEVGRHEGPITDASRYERLLR